MLAGLTTEREIRRLLRGMETAGMERNGPEGFGDAETFEVFKKCMDEGRVPIGGVGIKPNDGRGIGQFLLCPTLIQLCEITRDPVPYLGGATRAQKGKWSKEEKEHAQVYELIQRDFVNRKKSNVTSIAEYIIQILDGKITGYLPPPILWFTKEDDILVKEKLAAVKRSAYPHVIDGSTRVAGVHRVKQQIDAGELGQEYLEKMSQIKIPVIAIFGPQVDTSTAAQIFCDVNYKAVPVDPSLAKSMDKRDYHVLLAKELEKEVSFLKRENVSNRRQLTASDTRQFTAYGIYQTLRCFTDGIESLAKGYVSKTLASTRDLPEVTAKAVNFWLELNRLFGSQWAEPNSRDRYLHIHTPLLKAMGSFMRPAYFPIENQEDKKSRLAFLGSLDWSRENRGWLGTITKEGAKSIGIINNDRTVRDVAKFLEERSEKLPRLGGGSASTSTGYGAYGSGHAQPGTHLN